MVGIFVLSGLGAVAGTDIEDEKIVSEKIFFSQPNVINENNYVSLDVSEANSFIMEQGKPLLPSYIETFTFPFGTKINKVTCKPTNIQTQTLSKELMPTPKAVQVGMTVSNKEQKINYGTETYPSNWFEYDVSCGLYKGDRRIIVEVEICPMRYNPTEKTIEWTNQVDISIDYEEPAKQQSGADQYELVVIGPNEYSDEIAPLITHKNGRGVTSKFVGLSEVYGGTGRDNQEKIKYYIKDAIETWGTTNILLVGGSSTLPARETHIYIEEEDDPPHSYPEVFVSDLYYADIYNESSAFSTWDTNSNNIFGELDWEGNTDEIDLMPDVYLGRIPVTSGGQVTTIVNKIKTYENTPAYQQDWFTDMVVCGGDTSPGYPPLEGERVNQFVMDMMGGFIAEKMWVSNGRLTGLIPKTGVKFIKDGISEGCGFVDFSGHGNTNVWATHPEDEHSWVPTPNGYIRNTDIGQLTNGNKLPIIVVEACSTAKFNKDINTFNFAFLHNSNGGGIASFGATGLGWGYVGNAVTQGLIGKMGLDTFRGFALDEAVTVGEMWYNAQDRYIDPSMEPMDYKVSEEWILFGDPTLQVADESDPPNKPTKPSGPTAGKPGKKYTYSSSAIDPNGDQVYLLFEWGDGTTSGWVGPFGSGNMGSADKTWNENGAYEIRVAAKDTHGKVSDWSLPLEVNIPRSKSANIQSLFIQILERYPNLFPILRNLLGL